MTERPIAGRPEGKGAAPPRKATVTAVGPAVLEARRLRKVFLGGDGAELVVLDGVDLEVRRGEAVAIVGASGAGKSTLLHLLGGLDRPTSGEVVLEDRSIGLLPDADLAAVRNARIGFVFQFHHLLREFSAHENVALPMLIGGASHEVAMRRAEQLLAEVGLAPRLEHRPAQLSGGEQQRVAVARALANAPALLIADEPTGNLDAHTSERLHDLFFRLREEHGAALVLATHNRELADRADRILQLRGGRLESFYPEEVG
jgi:lipoprotein-releasing system ATP-binding protein